MKLEGARNNLWEFANIFIQILAFVIKSLVVDTRAFLLSLYICVDVGIPVLNENGKKEDLEKVC